LDKLNKAIFNGEVKTVVVWSLSRLTRKGAYEGLTMLAKWLDKGVRVVAIAEQFDFYGASGELVAAVLFAVAKMQGVKIGCPMMPYADCEEAVLNRLPLARLEGVLPKKNIQAKLVAKLRNEEHRVGADVAAKQEEIENFVDQIGRTKNASMRDSYEKRITNLQAEVGELKKQLSQIRSRLEEANRDSEAIKEWQDQLVELRAELAKGNREVRERLNAHLRQFIDHIDLFSKGYPDQFRDGTDGNMIDFWDAMEIESKLQGFKPESSSPQELAKYERFKTWAAEQLQSKNARFLRVYYREHGVIDRDGKIRFAFPYTDIPTEGSIAGSVDAVENLWQEYQQNNVRRVPR
jgi:DNA invertase Pin-like site-specific DNA recombinase